MFLLKRLGIFALAGEFTSFLGIFLNTIIYIYINIFMKNMQKSAKMYTFLGILLNLLVEFEFSMNFQ